MQDFLEQQRRRLFDELELEKRQLQRKAVKSWLWAVLGSLSLLGTVILAAFLAG